MKVIYWINFKIFTFKNFFKIAFVLLNGNQNQAFVQKFFHLLRNNHFDYHTFGDDNNVNIQNLTNVN